MQQEYIIANKISPQCQLIVPENGTISINIPLDSGRRSSCSTRTTHPTFIKRIQEALYAIGISNSIYNPYRLKSKADMVLECCQDTSKKAILESLVDLSCSCAKRGHNVFWDKSGIEIRNAKIKHCGMCLPCLYRRVALDTIGLDNEALLGTKSRNMIIDTHCHFDMMPNPEQYLKQQEVKKNISIGMTNLPSHFLLGYEHVRQYKFSRLALGFHPLYASENKNELRLFSQCLDKTSYIGEIGLDFSNEGLKTKDDQVFVLEKVLQLLSKKNKIVSVHSRRAEKVLFEMLITYGIKNVIFHWYSGPLSLIPKIVEHGYYFSVNEKMTKTNSGIEIIKRIPRNLILTETDAPFNKVCSISNTLTNIGLGESVIYDNFSRLISTIKR